MEAIAYPFSLVLMFLYNLVDNYGITLILFTIVVKLITLPFTAKSKKSMMKMARLTPRIKELEAKYANDRAKYNTEVSNLYRSEKVKPTAGCLWTILPLVIIIILYSLIRQPYTSMFALTAEEFDILKNGLTNVGVDVAGIIESAKAAYAELPIAQAVHQNMPALQALAATDAELAGVMNLIQDIDFTFLGIDLSQIPKFGFFLEKGVWSSPDLWQKLGLFLVPIFAGLSQLLASIVSQKTNDSVAQGQSAASSTKMMLYLMPIMSIWFSFIMPAGIGVYWVANSVVSMIQDLVLTKHYRKVYDAEDAEKARLEAIEREREEARQAERERKKALGIDNVVNPNTSKKKLAAQERAAKAAQKPLENMTPKELREYAAQLERKNQEEEEKRKSGMVGDRPYARGRNYDPERFDK